MTDNLDDLAAMIDAIDFSDATEQQSVHALSLLRILQRIGEIDSELRDRDELLSLNVKTERGRELHSERAALTIEKNSRLHD